MAIKATRPPEKPKSTKKCPPTTWMDGCGQHTYKEVQKSAEFDGAHFHCGFCGDSIFFYKQFMYCPTCNKKPSDTFLKKHFTPPKIELYEVVDGKKRAISSRRTKSEIEEDRITAGRLISSLLW